ncbi:amino acid ABC transporter permease [Thauera linaloolentis]|uniref:Amino acid ABC transporter permease n=1 Tax=Thauera linaloolentis (strain DSM 12138 / JCM 21573 / CCUG 41526 / CIP 105981 / IAM 15112 / NBRC 102519 / 47Lol) TaxID=1123367 RepID=N6XWC6_THAL4|nr:amino acid ABC transporter permease [Thauera linaloolentis]ENO86081.1 Amino acid ABC transporter permease [Thauera linaloolentis 47Lol = DSM 12138]MCM8565230.1 amino acid ABC transporter permease [Thauera linaloolentis]
MLDELLAPKYLGWLIEGFGVTLLLSALVSVAATALGLALCLGRIAPSRLWSWPARAWLSVFRNTPLLVQLFFWYFGASALMPEGLLIWLNTPHHWDLALFGVRWPSFEYLAGFFGLTLYTAAFIAEEFRSGVRGVPAGQIAAAQALGFTPLQVWLNVVMPQAFRISLPPLLGQYMNAVKNSSLTMAIGLAELSYASRQVETETFKTFQAFGVATALYILTIIVIELAGQWLQRRRPAPGAAGA